MITVRLEDWPPGLPKIELNRALRQEFGLSLSEAYRLVDGLVRDTRPEIVVDCEARAELLSSILARFGVGASVASTADVPQEGLAPAPHSDE